MAALAAKHNGRMRDLDIRVVQRTLLDQNAVLGTGPRAEEFA